MPEPRDNEPGPRAAPDDRVEPFAAPAHDPVGAMHTTRDDLDHAAALAALDAAPLNRHAPRGFSPKHSAVAVRGGLHLRGPLAELHPHALACVVGGADPIHRLLEQRATAV
jgi:hypothetical protein